MPAPRFIRRLCWASQALLQKLRNRRKSSGPVTDSTIPSCSCSGSRQCSRASPIASFQGSWGETPVTDEFLSDAAIDSTVQLGKMCELTAVNSDSVLSPNSSHNGPVYITLPEVDGSGSTDVSPSHHALHEGGLRVVNGYPKTYLSQTTPPSVDIVSSPGSSQEQIEMPSTRSLTSLSQSTNQRPQLNDCKRLYCSANGPNNTANNCCSVGSQVRRPTYFKRSTSISLENQAPQSTNCPPCCVPESELDTQALSSAPSNYWQFASSETPTPVSLEIQLSETTRRPPYPISEPESVFSNLPPVTLPRPLLITPRTSVSVRRQTSEMFLIDAQSLNSQQAPQLIDTLRFGRDGIGVAGMNISRGRLQTIASLEHLVDQERRDWAHGSLSPPSMISNTFPNHRSTWPWREFPEAGSFPVPSGLVAGLNAGQVAQDRRIWRNLFY